MLTRFAETFFLRVDDVLNWIEWQWTLHSTDIIGTIVLIIMGVCVYAFID